MDNPSISDTKLAATTSNENSDAQNGSRYWLQSSIGDPSFADVFIAGRPAQADAPDAVCEQEHAGVCADFDFSRLLELDKGWGICRHQLIERYVDALYCLSCLLLLSLWSG